MFPAFPHDRRRLSSESWRGVFIYGQSHLVHRCHTCVASLLSHRSPPVIVRRVTLSRILALLVTVLLISGCSPHSERRVVAKKSYYRVRVTNLRGELVSDWVAEGRPFRTERGYRFRAVERVSAPPYMMTTQYPHGRVTEVTGPNIVVTPASKPYWLFAMDGY